jgi:D-amino peptidase
MKVLISADGEGVSGITSSDELVKGKAEYERFRHLMTADVNAAIEGAAAGGADEIIVNDSHWGMNNILPEELDPRADLVRGFHKPLCMMHGVEDDIDTIFCVGYHAKVGHSDGVANETMIGREMIEIRMNGRPVGELDINATIAAHYGRSISLVSGDDAFVAEARATLGGDVEASITKYAVDRWTARCIGLDRSRASIRAAAERATRRAADGAFRPVALDLPITYEVEFTSTSEAVMGALTPGAERTNFRTVRIAGDDALAAWRGLFTVILMGWSATDEVYG